MDKAIMAIVSLSVLYCVGCYFMSNAVARYLGKDDPTLQDETGAMFINCEGKLERLDDHEVGVSK